MLIFMCTCTIFGSNLSNGLEPMSEDVSPPISICTKEFTSVRVYVRVCVQCIDKRLWTRILLMPHWMHAWPCLTAAKTALLFPMKRRLMANLIKRRFSCPPGDTRILLLHVVNIWLFVGPDESPNVVMPPAEPIFRLSWSSLGFYKRGYSFTPRCFARALENDRAPCDAHTLQLDEQQTS